MNTGKPWTPGEIDTVLHLVGTIKISAIATKLGRTECAVKARIWRETRGGGGPRGEALRTRGMGVTETANALGVYTGTVNRWLRRGNMPGRQFRIEKQFVWVIDPDELTDIFLEQRGYALASFIKPSTAIWRDIVQEIRDRLNHQLIHSYELCDVLALGRINYSEWRKRYDFPQYAVRIHPGTAGGGGGDWYKRSEIEGWLKLYPRYITKSAVEVFGLEE